MAEELPKIPQPEKVAQKISTIRTYQGDVTSVVKGENLSMADISLRERARQLRGGEGAPDETNRNKILIAGTIVLFLMSVGLITYFTFFRNTNGDEKIVLTPQSLIFADKTTVADSTGLESPAVLRQVRRALAETRTLGTVEDIVLSTKVTPLDAVAEPIITPLSAQTFLQILAPRAPDAFVRLLGTSFMYGIHGFSKNFGFLFFETDAQERVYSELLSWEKLSLARDLTPLLRETSTLDALETSTFEDVLIKNIDTRVLRDQNGEIVLIYAFLNPKQLLMAGSQETFVEVLRRFTTPRPVVR